MSNGSNGGRIYAVITNNPHLARKMWKKYNSRVKAIIIVVELDKPQRIAPLGQKYDIKIKKIDYLI